VAREREADSPEERKPEPAQRMAAVLALQRAAGNRAVTRALLQRAPDPPAGVTLGADPLPPGLTTTDPDKARVTPDPSVGGGWTDPGGKVIPSGTVGGVDRILLEEMPGNQAQQDTQDGAPGAGTPGLANTAGRGSGLRGRAIALVPRSVRTGPAGEVAVLVHFHGIGRALRATDNNPRDVQHAQMEQQLEAFVNSRPGARIIALLPIGIQTENDKGLHSVSFGNFKTDDFIAAAFGKLGSALPSGSTPGDVMMSAHSGGGLPLGGMLSSGKGLPARLKGVFLFEALHGDVDNYIAFIVGRLKGDLTALKAERDKPGADDAAVFAAQAAYLQGSLHVVAFGGAPGDDQKRGYAARTLKIRDAILKWWEANASALKAAAGPRHEILDKLWAHYQAQFFPGSTHENALASANNNLGRALASMEQVGALAATPKTPAPPQSAPPPPPHLKATPTTDSGKAAAAGEAAGEGVLARSALAREFKTEKYELSKAKVPVVKANDEKKRALIEEAPADYANEILRDAKLDPATWFSNFTTITFLGQAFNDPIHVDLATHLKAVEKTFADKYGGGKPEEAGKVLGLHEAIHGAREKPTSAAVSMHLFGLAIDVNYTTNPFIGSSANPVFERAGKLLGRPTKGFTNNMTYDQVAELDKLLEDYFKLLTDTTKDEATRKQIQKDLDFVTGKWERTKPAQKAAIEAGGFLDLDKRFVEEIGLDWGASYGDIMHFDMRNKGNGLKIHGAVNRYKAKKDAESAKAYEDAHKPAAAAAP
jgi:hypothetical protein